MCAAPAEQEQSLLSVKSELRDGTDLDDAHCEAVARYFVRRGCDTLDDVIACLNNGDIEETACFDNCDITVQKLKGALLNEAPTPRNHPHAFAMSRTGRLFVAVPGTVDLIEVTDTGTGATRLSPQVAETHFHFLTGVVSSMQRFGDFEAMEYNMGRDCQHKFRLFNIVGLRSGGPAFIVGATSTEVKVGSYFVVDGESDNEAFKKAFTQKKDAYSGDKCSTVWENERVGSRHFFFETSDPDKKKEVSIEILPSSQLPRRFIITIEAHHDFAHEVANELCAHPQLKSAAKAAFENYLHASLRAARQVALGKLPATDEELHIRGSTTPVSIFRKAVPLKLHISAGNDKVEQRGIHQTTRWCDASSGDGRGYVAFPCGQDIIGNYKFFPCGALVDVKISPKTRAKHWIVNEHAVVVDIQVVRVSERGLDLESFRTPQNRERDASHIYYYQAHLLRTFIAKYAPKAVDALPVDLRAVVKARFPLAHILPGPNTSWKASALAYLTADVPDPVAEAIFSDLTSSDNVEPGSLLAGLPGLGKSYLGQRLIISLGLAADRDSLHQMVAPLGSLIGGTYVGDVTAAFCAMFLRACGATGLYLNLLDEVDLTSQHKSDGTNEQISQWLTGFTNDAKAPNFHLLCTTNNDTGIVGAIKSRFTGRRYDVGPMTFTQLAAYFETQHRGDKESAACEYVRTMSPASRGLRRPECCKHAAAVSLGLSTRSIRAMRRPAPTDSNHNNINNPVAKQHAEMGSVLPDGTQGLLTVADVYSFHASKQSHGAKLLVHFLVTATRQMPDLCTGRMIAHQTRVSGRQVCVVDVEVVSRSGSIKLDKDSDPSHCHYLHADRDASHVSRHYELTNVRELYWALHQTMLQLDGACLQPVTSTFVQYILAASNCDNLDDRVANAVHLTRQLCFGPCRVAAVLTPLSLFGITCDAGKGQHRATLPNAFNRFCDFTGLFAATDAQKHLFTVALCTSTAEVEMLALQAHFPVSPYTKVVLDAHSSSKSAFRCVRCGEPGIQDDGETGCLHVPQRGMVLRCKVKASERTPHDLPSYETSVGTIDSLKDIRSATVIGCTCTLANRPPTVGAGGERCSLETKCGVPHHFVCIISNDQQERARRAARCVVTPFELREGVTDDVDVEDALRAKHRYGEIRVKCGNWCNTDIATTTADGDAACPSRTHQAPTMTRYRVPQSQRTRLPCDFCDHAKAICMHCSRLIPPHIGPLWYKTNRGQRYVLLAGQLHAVSEDSFASAFHLSGHPRCDDFMKRIDEETGAPFPISRTPLIGIEADRTVTVDDGAHTLVVLGRIALTLRDAVRIGVRLRAARAPSTASPVFRPLTGNHVVPAAERPAMCATEGCPCTAAHGICGNRCHDSCAASNPCASRTHVASNAQDIFPRNEDNIFLAAGADPLDPSYGGDTTSATWVSIGHEWGVPPGTRSPPLADVFAAFPYLRRLRISAAQVESAKPPAHMEAVTIRFASIVENFFDMWQPLMLTSLELVQVATLSDSLFYSIRTNVARWLRRLNLSGSWASVQPAHADALIEMLSKATYLAELLLAGLTLNDDWRQKPALRGLSLLTKLDVSGYLLDPTLDPMQEPTVDATPLMESLASRQLNTLSCVGCAISETAVGVLKDASSNVLRLDMPAGLIAQANERSFDFSRLLHARVSGPGDLIWLDKCKALQTLDLGATPTHMPRLVAGAVWRVAPIAAVRFPPGLEAIPCFDEFSGLSNLTALDVSRAKTPVLRGLVAQMTEFRKLHRLNVNYCESDATTIAGLVAGLSASMTHLYVAGARLRSDAIARISEFAELSAIDVSDCTDDNGSTLDASRLSLACWPALRWLRTNGWANLPRDDATALGHAVYLETGAREPPCVVWTVV